MGTVVDSLFSVLMSWVRALVSGIWALFSQENTTLLEFLGKNWMLVAAALIAAGLVIDWLVWLVRWQPYHIWAQRVRRLLRLPQEDPEEEEDEPVRHARPAVTPAKKRAQRTQDWDDEAAWEAQAAYAAYEAAGAPAVDEEEEREAAARAEEVPDEELGVYPGMQYDSARSGGMSLHETQRYSALSSEGPGAAEVSRRKEEIEAYRRMQEEAAERAKAERIARMEEEKRRREDAQRAQEMRMQEEARLAQEAYERELAQYEEERAQYERELAEYERKKAEYDAYVAAKQEEDRAAEQAAAEAAARGQRRRRTRAQYSEMTQGEEVNELPDAPAWPLADDAEHALPQEAEEDDKGEKKRGFMDRMAWIMEGEEADDVFARSSLPPRVDRNEAYRPAKTPRKTEGRGAGSRMRR